MKRFMSRKFGAFLLLIVVVTMAANGLCLAGSGGGACLDTYLNGCSAAAVPDHCPVCPSDGHSDDGCVFCANCPCQHSLAPQSLHIHHAPPIALLVPFEPFKALPEVYLPKFIPPQNLV